MVAKTTSVRRPCGNIRPLKVLFVAEAMTLAHVVRLVTLADSLCGDGADVVLAADPRYAELIGTPPYPVVPLDSLPARRFSAALASGARIYDHDTLARYAREELALFDRHRPDAVVGDFRLSLGASARHAGIPFVNLTNAYWSPHARVRQLVPEYGWVRWLGVVPAGALFRAVRAAGFAHHARPVNRLRRDYGLASLGGDFGALLVDGDLACFADSPLVVPVDRLSPGQCFIGPLPWSPRVPLPDWWEAFARTDDGRPAVYVNLGSSGPPEALQGILDALANMPVRVIAASPGRPAAHLRLAASARAAALLPGDEACAVASLVICNGGSPATYQALAEGVPVIGVATNMDQFLNMAAVEDAGCGILLRSGHLEAEGMRAAVLRALSDPGLRSAARRVAAALARTSATVLFREALGRLLGRASPPGS